MKIPQRAIQFKEVLPSSLLICFLGLGAFWLYPHWTWFGGLGLSVWLLGILIGVLSYLASFTVSRLAYFEQSSLREILNNLHRMFGHFTWLQIILVSLLAGIGEELLMRGLLQSGLQQALGVTPAIVLTALVFGALHFMNLTYMVLTFVIGLVFGLIFYWSNSLLLVMVAHAVYDVCAFTIIVKFPHMLGLQLHNEQSDEQWFEA